MNENSAVVLEILKLCFVMLTVPLQLLNIAFSICGIYPDLMHSSVHTKSTCGSCGQSWCMISSVSYYLIGQRFWLWCLPRGPGCPWTHSVDQHHWSWHSHCSPQICIILSVITFCYTPGHLAHIFLFFSWPLCTYMITWPLLMWLLTCTTEPSYWELHCSLFLYILHCSLLMVICDCHCSWCHCSVMSIVPWLYCLPYLYA